MLTRRELLRTAAGTAAALAIPGLARAQPARGFTLPPLPYPNDALEPHIDAKTMEIHHDRHHAAYVANLNKALSEKAPEWLSKPIEEVVANVKKLPEDIHAAVRNNGGGHYNHSLFWTMMAKPGTGGEPKGELLKALTDSFGGVDGFKKEFQTKAVGQFGSGWAWLVVGKEKPLAVAPAANQDNPLMVGIKPLLGVDVWEHAYYLKYQNARPKYVEAWFNLINWNRVAELYAAARKG
jgi:Fe-Mn family superoxide dismutase